MKNVMCIIARRNQVSFLITVCFVLSCFTSPAQAPPPVYARLALQKVPPGKEQEFVKFMKENMKPLHNHRRSQGKIIHWILFKVHFTGADDNYNYVGVQYYANWANTEANDGWASILKQVNPQADPVAFGEKFRELSTMSTNVLVYRTDAVEPATPQPFKYIRIDYMKVKPGMEAQYLKVEREDWMPVHKALVDGGQSTAWGLWRAIFPGGTDSSYDYVTSIRYSNYAQIMEVDYEKTFKKASPAKDVNAIADRTTKSRDLVKSEVWEVIDMLQ
jgi:hypothetical protein